MAYDSNKGCFAVHLMSGKQLLPRPQILRMGMKEHEMSSEDEELLLSLKPQHPAIKRLPKAQHMADTCETKGSHASSSGHLGR